MLSLGQKKESSMQGQDTRGQTTLDFAFGMSVFIAVIMFIFLFIPGILDPFTAGVQEETVTTNRVADELTHGLLGSTSRPKVLNQTCTTRFFAGDEPSGCNYYGDSSSGVAERIGIDETRNVNVTIYGNVSANGNGREILCWDNGASELAEEGTSDCDTPFTGGGTPPTRNDDSVTATRVASLFHEDVTMEVVMW